MAAYSNGVVTVGTTPTLIASAIGATGILVQNQGAGTVYLGGSTVTADATATGGVTLAATASITIPTSGAEQCDLYAIVASGTAKVAYLMPAPANVN